MSNRKKVTLAVVGSVLLHLLIILSVSGINAVWPQTDTAEAKPETESPQLTLLDSPPAQQQERQYVRTNEDQKTDQDPVDSMFESDKDTAAASEQDAKGRAPLPTQDGKEIPDESRRSPRRPDSSDLYDPTDPIKFRIESGGQFEDLPRDSITNQAFIGDPRNDENMIIAGLHAAFLLFHNHAVDLIRSQNPSIPDNDAFFQARRFTLWHYQWMILHEFLPHVVSQSVIDDVLTNGRRFYRPLPNDVFIPVEFQITYRFGHSMVRPSYRANLHGDNGQPFFGMIFDPAGENSADPVDLRGGARAPRRFIGWQTFFDFGGALSADVRPNKRIDTKISTPLFDLPLGAILSNPAGTPPTSLMQRNLLRTLTWGIPSGQSIASQMGIPPLSNTELAELQPIRASFVESTPLFYYILKEAELREDGLRLGPLGGRIVAEVFIGLLQLDPESYLSVQPYWLPTLPTHDGTPQSFRMIDFLTFAGVDPNSRGQ